MMQRHIAKHGQDVHLFRQDRVIARREFCVSAVEAHLLIVCQRQETRNPCRF